jgi:putative DNA primase/helicase
MTQTNDSIFRPANALEAALKYRADGLAPIPVPFREKAPRLKGWQHTILSIDELPLHFAAHSNIGVLNGAPSGGLVDVDLDCAEALVAAGVLLPSTLRFGRASRPESHYLYRCPDVKTKRFVDPIDKACLMEIRSDGSQTVFPPSIHPSGEMVQFANDTT